MSKKKSKKIIAKILVLTGISVVAIVVVIGAAFLSYGLAMGGGREMAPSGPVIGGNSGTGSLGESSSDSDGGLPDIHILVLGFDNYSLADVIFAVLFNGETGAIDAISIPRDTQTQLSEEQRNRWREMGSVPPDNPFRVNELPNRTGPAWGGTAGNNNRLPLMKNYLEPIFGITFDYYITINLRGFRNIVDAIDGVETYIAQRMFYDEPGTDFVINIWPGYQRLTGAQAEQVVRYRGGLGDDLFRIRSQQNLMRDFFAQLLTFEALMNAPLTLALEFMNHVNTDIATARLQHYINRDILNILDAENINFHIIPGEIREIAPHVHRFFIDIAQTQELVREIRD
jgi:LCP family protein required for cell wall assembly